MNYCVYLTCYKGNKLPPFYIGSSTIEKIKNGYRGSVSSKVYKNIWKTEIKNNSHLFKTIIISNHDTREEALEKENKFQHALNVVHNNLYINKSYAAKNGFFGRDVKGQFNPRYGVKVLPETRLKISNSNLGKKWSDEQHAKFLDYSNEYWNSERGINEKQYRSEKYSGENNPMFGKSAMKGKKHSEETCKKISTALTKPKSKEHAQKATQIYSIEREYDGTIITGSNLSLFCKTFLICIRSLLQTYNSKKFYKGLKVIEKHGRVKNIETNKLLIDLF
jgi:hypothetical protein